MGLRAGFAWGFRPLFLLTFLAGAVAAQTPEPRTDPAPPSIPATSSNPSAPADVLLTVSGGVSMGSYQGGFTWAVISHLRRDPGLRLRGAAGASAGNINSLLSVLEYCRDGRTLPRESLFWKLWIQTGIDDLMPPFDPAVVRARRAAVREALANLPGDRGPAPEVWDDPAEGIFSRDFFHVRQLELLTGVLDSESWERCGDRAIPVGITITSLTPRRMPLDREGRLWATTIRVASGYVVRFGDKVRFGQLPRPLREARGLGALVALPSDTAGIVSTIDVFKLTEASSAFPVAFAPRALRFYHPETLVGDVGACPQNVAGTCNLPEREYFIDGGVFDNNPVDLVWSLTHPEPAPADPGTRLIYIDPDNYRSPLAGARAARGTEVATGGIDALLQLAESAVPAARQYELQSLQRVIQRYDPGVGDALRITDRALPIYGDHVGAFAAFFGKPLRMHDFYVGVYDGLHFIASELICQDTDTMARRQCVDDRVREEIEGRHGFPMDATAQLMLRSMFVAEGGEGTRPPGLSMAGTAEDSVLLDLLRQDLALLEPGVARACDHRAPFHAAICASGLEQAMEGLTPRSRAVVHGWAREPACMTDGAFLDPECRAGPSFVRLLDDPAGFSERLTEEMLERVRLVEDQRNRAGASNQETSVELVQMAYRSGADRYKRYAFEWDPSTIPDRDRTPGGQLLHYVLPYYFMGAMGDDGNEVGWRPRLHLGSPWALDGLIGIHTWTGSEPRLALGLGPSLKATPWATVNLSAVRTSATRFWDGDAQIGVEGSLRLLTDKLAVAVRWLPDNTSTMFEGEELGIMVGLTDVNGLIYMIASSLD